MKKISFLLFLAAGFFAINGCQKDSNNGYKGLQSPKLPASLYNYSDIDIPAHFDTGFGYSPNINFDLTDATATLGRVLFYDTKLSLSNEVSCGSCHHQSKGFSDKVALSEGIINNHTPRNSQAIINPALQQTYFWDSRVSDLEEMVLLPIQNHNELGIEKLNDLVDKLGKVDYYKPLFEEAYGDSAIDESRIATALADFLESMFSADSKHDQAMNQLVQTGSESVFSGQELAGKAVFEDSGCNGCHGGPDLRGTWGDDWANIGLEMDYTDNGLGEEGSVFFAGQGSEGLFKVPSLRNIELTGPYMHDGRFASLMEVINHYDEGIVAHPNLDWRLSEGFNVEGPTPKRLNLSNAEKENLVAFLKTFTDESLINDERFSDPFQ